MVNDAGRAEEFPETFRDVVLVVGLALPQDGARQPSCQGLQCGVHLSDRHRTKASVKHLERLERHARSDAAGIEQPAVGCVVAKQQRANERSRTFRVRPSDDDELSPVKAFALDPGAAVAWHVGQIDA